MSSTMQVDEVCKVRNAAVGRAGMGYSLAIFKGYSLAFYYARVALIDASFMPDKKLVTVELDTLKKMKQAQRKALQRKVTKACATVEEAAPLPAASPPLFGSVTEEYNDVMSTSAHTNNDDGLSSGNSKKKMKASGNLALTDMLTYDLLKELLEHDKLKEYEFVLKQTCTTFAECMPKQTRTRMATVVESVTLLQCAHEQGCPWN
eukprot:5099090-Prymnesium_polylepis.1